MVLLTETILCKSSDPSKVSSTKPMDYKEKIEPCPATAADSIADGLGKNLSFDASDSTSRQPSQR